MMDDSVINQKTDGSCFKRIKSVFDVPQSKKIDDQSTGARTSSKRSGEGSGAKRHNRARPISRVEFRRFAMGVVCLYPSILYRRDCADLKRVAFSRDASSTIKKNNGKKKTEKSKAATNFSIFNRDE